MLQSVGSQSQTRLNNNIMSIRITWKLVRKGSLGPHFPSPASKPAFYQDPQLICMPTSISEAQGLVLCHLVLCLCYKIFPKMWKHSADRIKVTFLKERPIEPTGPIINPFLRDWVLGPLSLSRYFPSVSLPLMTI